MKQKLISGLLVLFVAALVFLFVSPDYREGEPSIHGKQAQDFALTVNGKPMHLSDFRGHVVILNFWASWCQPCADEAPSLNQLQTRIAAYGGTILGVDPDVGGEDQTSYQKFLNEFHIGFPTYLDTSHQIAASYGTVVYPETYVIGPDGKFDRKIIGPQDWTSPQIVSYLDTLMTKKSAVQESSLLP